jgi:hypothetical protein
MLDSQSWKELADLGRMQTADLYMQRVWPLNSKGRLSIIDIQGSHGLKISPEAAMVSTANTALLLIIDSVKASNNAAFREWQMGDLYSHGTRDWSFYGHCVLLLDTARRQRGHTVRQPILHGHERPEEGYATYRSELESWRTSGLIGTNSQEAEHLRVLESLSIPSIGNYSVYE